MLNIKNNNTNWDNNISNFVKKLKLIINYINYDATFFVMCVFILQSYQNNNDNFHDSVISSKVYTSDIDYSSLETIEAIEVVEEVEMLEKMKLVEDENEENIENLLENMPKLIFDSEGVYYREAKVYEYTEEEFVQICKIVFLEAGGETVEEKYIDSMAVTSVILNRIEDERWCVLGSTPLEQIYAENQFSSLNASLYLDYDEVPEYTKKAVFDCLNGIRNNIYVSFRSKENFNENRIQIVNQGNNYFEKMNEIEKVLIKK